MITILPLNQLWEEDKALFGAKIVELAELAHLGLPVAPGIVISAPSLSDLPHRFNLDQSLTPEQFQRLISYLADLPIPASLAENLPVKLEVTELWQQIIASWQQQLRHHYKYHPEIDLENLFDSLSAQEVMLVQTNFKPGKLQFDFSTKSYQIILDQADLTPEVQQQLDGCLAKIKSKRLLPANYQFIVTTDLHSNQPKVWLTSVDPPVEPSLIDETAESILPLVAVDQTPIATKLFVTYPLGQLLTDLDARIADELLLSSPLEVLSQPVSQWHDVNQLILPLAFHQPEDQFIRQIDYILNFKANLDPNIHLVIGLQGISSAEEYNLAIKRLSNLRLTDPQQAYWLIIENAGQLLAIEHYLTAGIGGVQINLDQLVKSLHGGNHQVLSPSQQQSLEQLLKTAFKQIHQSKLPILVAGDLLKDLNWLKLLLKNGVWGIVTDQAYFTSLKQRVAQLERQVEIL